MRHFLYILILFQISCLEKNEGPTSERTSQNIAAIKISAADATKISDYVNKAQHSGMNSNTYQVYMDSALMIKPDSAYLWQQKAMPLYKARKYSVGKPFLAKAVEYDPEGNLDYSGFMKCIFSKEYEESIEELLEAKDRFGDSYVMDHTYNFYIGLDYLQLNQFEKAKEYLLKSQKQQFADFPKDPPEEACHYLDWFYLGIVEAELDNHTAAIHSFDMSLKVYKNFGDAMYNKAYSLAALERMDEAKLVFKEALKNKGNTINEDNVFYEVYPYQVFHRLSQLSRAVK